MREIGARSDGPVCEVVPGGDHHHKVASVATAARRRRRLELRRVGRTTPAEENDGSAVKRIRTSCSSDSLPSANTDPRGSPSLSHGAVSVIGRRREMEDAVAVARAFLDGDKDDHDFFGVYDGHGGARVAQACSERLHVVLAEELAARRRRLLRTGTDDEDARRLWKDAMLACFAKVDNEVTGGLAAADVAADDLDSPFRTVGSTAVVAVVGHRRIVVANCGDSRAVLSRGGVAVPLSTDHKPDRPDELQRVEAAGGRIINWNGYRVLGVLATSRSIGDYYLKPFVSAEPEVTVTERTEQDEFLILASDGLWDVLSNDVACRIARNCLNGRAASLFPGTVRGSTAADAAALLTELAIARGSTDNISVVVVELRRLKGTS